MSFAFYIIVAFYRVIITAYFIEVNNLQLAAFQYFRLVFDFGARHCRLLVCYLPLSNKTNIMRSILYIIAVILVIGWVLGAFVWNAGSLIYILLVLAIVSFLLGVIRRGDV